MSSNLAQFYRDAAARLQVSDDIVREMVEAVAKDLVWAFHEEASAAKREAHEQSRRADQYIEVLKSIGFNHHCACGGIARKAVKGRPEKACE